ncbi:MAG: lipopolysaccharide biosynthesis protein [Burkholderiales bacterium]|nr:lipopolysaccharide biosynthesis protein [Burkholderiales bacterium]
MSIGASENRADAAYDDGIDLLELMLPLLESWKLWLFGSIAAGLVALGVAFIVPPIFTARTSLLPPQQQQSAMASALSSLGGLAGLTGLSGAVKSPADQYVALMQSVTVQDRLIDQFDLMRVYGEKLRFDARRTLETNTRVSVGKKDGLLVVEVDDESPQRAADLANAYVEELRRLTSTLAVSEAQQRRAFFEKELKAARDQLAAAQKVLQASGFDVAALRAEPRAAAENYARLKAQITAAEVRAQVLRGTLAEGSPELRQQLDQLAALRTQLARLERAADGAAATDYVSAYREFKYREALFELFARQYELARVDESREGALIQVVDAALPPERKSRPKRAVIALLATFGAFLLLGIAILIRHHWREAARDPARSPQLARLRAAIGR